MTPHRVPLALLCCWHAQLSARSCRPSNVWMWPSRGKRREVRPFPYALLYERSRQATRVSDEQGAPTLKMHIQDNFSYGLGYEWWHSVSNLTLLRFYAAAA